MSINHGLLQAYKAFSHPEQRLVTYWCAFLDDAMRQSELTTLGIKLLLYSESVKKGYVHHSSNERYKQR